MIVRFHHGDYLDVLPSIDGVDAIIMDPPYGLRAAKRGAHSRIRDNHAWPDDGWDDAILSGRHISAVLALGVPTIIWGGNYYELPPSPSWLVWDKAQPENFSMAAFELAWTNIGGAARKHKTKTLQQGKHDKVHPAQKPLSLMLWCLDLLKLRPGAVVFDPCMGSGTVGQACAQRGLGYVGCESSAHYFAVGRQRVLRAYEDAARQPALEM